MSGVRGRRRRGSSAGTGIFQALERAFDYSAAKAPVVILTEHQTSAVIRRIGVKRLTAWLERRKVCGAADVATGAVEAARTAALSREARAQKLVLDPAHLPLALDERIKDNDREIRDSLRTDDRAEIIESVLGMGPILGAEFVTIVGDLSGYRDAGCLASHAVLAPVPRDSGRSTGNHHRPERCNHRLRRLFYRSAQYYLKKRADGMIRTQAILSLARRRANVLWAMLRDKRRFTSAPPATQAG
ncbi:mobile element protein [Streptomyces sp. NL15-2K]|nr:mobile element protein [Streptomyces sp. NL15-2K]